MRIAELSRRSGVPVATVKFYLRERLLPEGRRTSATQAQYDDGHLARLRLIRALVGPGGLSLAAVGDVLAALDGPPPPLTDLFGRALQPTSGETGPRDRTAVHALLERLGWADDLPSEPPLDELAAALAALDDAGFALPPSALDAYAHHVAAIADAEVAGVPADDPAAAVRYVVLGTVLVEPVLLALRRLAHLRASVARFGGGPR